MPANFSTARPLTLSTPAPSYRIHSTRGRLGNWPGEWIGERASERGIRPPRKQEQVMIFAFAISFIGAAFLGINLASHC